MPEINIANSAGRDALVALESVRSTLKVRWLDEQGRQVESARLLKGAVDRDLDALLARYGELPSVGKALLEGDPEVDLENTGRLLRHTSRVYVDGDRQIVHKVHFWEIVRNPDGSQRERRPRRMLDPNLAGEQPLRWSGVYIRRDQACRKFVFSSKVQLRHTNGLTYDFLYGMAKELERNDCLMLLGAGAKSKEPLILRRGGSPYRGFLEGRTQGDTYSLVLHFSDLELKAPQETPPPEAAP
ncbi:MAG TPA: hypothetical protein VMV69_25015 [Pirellulales bacterium]|nr:hypothetical protein [Pirellulales bacterium]